MKARAPLLVGLVLLLSVATLVGFIVQTGQQRMGDHNTYEIYADFTDASGLRSKTRVQISGVDVGAVVDIQHVRKDNGRIIARVKFRIFDTYPIYENAWVRKAAESLLGDFRIDLDPGTPDYPLIPPGGVITNVQSVSDIEEIQSQLRRVASNVNQVTESFAAVLAGPEGEGSIKEILTAVEHSMKAIEQTTAVLSDIVTRNDDNINRVLDDFSSISHAIQQSTADGGAVRELLDNLALISRRLTPVVESVAAMVGEDQEHAGSVRETMDNINQTAARLSEVSRKMSEGQGTLGRLMNDETLITNVEETAASINELLGGFARLRTELELRTEYGVPFGAANEQVQAAIKNTLALRLWPKPDKYYLIEAVADPRGRQIREVIATTEGGVTSKQEVVTTSFNALKFSAQFAKRYYFLTMRFGILENTGGLGANLHFLNDRLEFRLDMFDFDRRDPDANESINPRFRGIAMYEFMNHLWVQAGIDDPFNSPLRTWFVGGVLRFTDDDLKSLLPFTPSP